MGYSFIVSCFDTNDEAVDSFGDTCDWYEYNPLYCGDYDDDDFEAKKMCCACKSTGNPISNQYFRHLGTSFQRRNDYSLYVNFGKYISVPSYTCTRGHCGAMDNNFIIGSREEIAIACSKSWECEGFQFSDRYEGGALCSGVEIVVVQKNNTGDEPKLQICSLDSGKNFPCRQRRT